MSKIKIEDIRKEAQSINWTLVSQEYKNLDSDLIFECPQHHTVATNLRKWRAKPRCPTCDQEFIVKDLKQGAPRKAYGVTRFLALDDATGTTGYSILDDNNLIHYGKITMNENDAIHRITSVRHWLISMLDYWKPDIVGIEDIQLQKGKLENVKIFKVLAQLQGALLSALCERDIEFVVIPPVTWRSTCCFTSKTRSDQKREAQTKVKEWYGIDATQDEADAICIGYHMVKNFQEQKASIAWGERYD